MTRTTLKDIIRKSGNIYMIKISKPSGRDRRISSRWKFTMDDSRWDGRPFDGRGLRMVTLRVGNGFFLAYKDDTTNEYFVDPKRAMYRNGAAAYVNSIVEYSVKTNDISRRKDDPSFRVTQGEMRQRGIDNFIDLCYEYMDFTAIGTGYTRDIRNLVVMDIDIDCTRPDNKVEIDNFLNVLSGYGSLPDFYIFNRNSKHVQLQWVIKDLVYKDINQDTVNSVKNEIMSDPDRNKEIDYRKTDFMDISQDGILYRKYSRALCDVVKKRNFGDKNYTFWKAKNPMSALNMVDGLELMMPYTEDGRVEYRTYDEMINMFNTKEGRERYYEESPTLGEWYSRLSGLLDPIVGKITDRKMLKLKDDDDIAPVREYVKRSGTREGSGGYGRSRNKFVVECTRYTTARIARRYGCRKKEDFSMMRDGMFEKFKEEVISEVRRQYDEKNSEYGGIWPETTNRSTFTDGEFMRAFMSSFTYVIQNNNDYSYTDENRNNSLKLRRMKKEIRIIVVDEIRSKYKNISRNDLLGKVNTVLKEIHIDKISMGSLKRFIIASKGMDDEQREYLRCVLNERKKYISCSCS